MRKLFAALAALWLLSSPAYAQKTQAQLSSEINTTFQSCGNGCITATALRTVLQDVIASFFNVLSPQTGRTFLASPADGSTGNPAYRAVTVSDLPSTSSILDTIGSSQGTVLYRGASGWSALGPGSTGQVLQTGGALGNPAWANVAGTGTVTSVTCGTGLTGGTFTGVGTCALSTPVTVGNGGTGAATLTTNGLLLGNGSGAITATAAPTSGQIIVGQSAAAPAPATMSGDCTIVASGAITCTKTNGSLFGNAATLTAGAAASNVVQLDGSARLPAVDGSQLINLPSTISVPVRQTVLSGPATSGVPNFLPATSGTLSLTSQNVSTGTSALVVTAATGFTTTGALNVVGISTSNLTWSSLTASTTNYLGVTISGGTLTTLSTTTAPIYQRGGTISVTSGQYTFDIVGMQMYLGNGSVANPVNVVFVGSAVTSGSGVTSTIAYAYQGVFDSGYIATLPGIATNTTLNANLGVQGVAALSILCTITNDGYAVGDEVYTPSTQSASAASYPVPVMVNGNVASFSTASVTAFLLPNKTTGVTAGLTAADWSYRMIVRRPW